MPLFHGWKCVKKSFGFFELFLFRSKMDSDEGFGEGGEGFSVRPNEPIGVNDFIILGILIRNIGSSRRFQ